MRIRPFVFVSAVLELLLVLLLSVSYANADTVYTRIPSGNSVSNPVSVELKGTFGADFCDSNTATFTVHLHRDNGDVFTTNAAVGTPGNFVDDVLQFPTLPIGRYLSVQLICFERDGNVTSSILESGNPAFSVLGIGPLVWSQAVVGQHYSLPLQVLGGSAPYTWSIESGQLPNGLSLDAATGVISGTPTIDGSFPVTVHAQDATGGGVSKSYALAVYPSAGGFSYQRTPSGANISNPMTIELMGVFGADFCDINSVAFAMHVLRSNGDVFTSNTPTATVGNAVDSVLQFPTLPQDSYLWTQLVCFEQDGSNVSSFIENGNPAFSVSTNQPPVLTPIGNKTVLEGQTLTFTLSATDPDGDSLTYSASNLPSGATFDPSTRTFTWTPSFGQAGNYTNVEFTVQDSGTPMQLAFEDITISVGHVNRPPVLTNPGPQQVLEHNTLTFTVGATDPDGDAVTLSATGLPSGATFNPSTGVFTWTPGYPSVGVYTPTFIATDNGTPQIASSSIDVVITVGSNPTPTEQSQTLVNVVNTSGLPTNTQNSYLANLNKVGTFIQQGKTQAAINQLNAFIQKVNQDYAQGTITQAEHDQYISLANTLVAALQ